MKNKLQYGIFKQFVYFASTIIRKFDPYSKWSFDIFNKQGFYLFRKHYYLPIPDEDDFGFENCIYDPHL